MKSSSENPYKSPQTRPASDDTGAPSPTALRPTWDAIVLASIAAVAAPLMWSVCWFFAIYLRQPDGEGGFVLTEYERFDTLYGYLPWTLLISVIGSPLVLLWKISSRSRGES